MDERESTPVTDRLVRGQSAVEFFREQLERAMEHQKVSTSAFTQYYLVNLLAGCLRGELPPSEPGYDETPLAVLYVRAIHSSRRDRAKLLRAMGDTAHRAQELRAVTARGMDGAYVEDGQRGLVVAGLARRQLAAQAAG